MNNQQLGLVNQFSKKAGILIVAMAMNGVSAEILFEENFDDQPDWTSAMYITDTQQFKETHNLPDGWYSIRQDPSWSPSKGYSGGHESIEILGTNSDKARNGTGKSYVSWRDSRQEPEYYWSSESIMSWFDPTGFDQLYVEFWITFSDTFTFYGNTSKIFRIGSWSGEGSIYNAFGGGDQGPLIMWNIQESSYGIRNYLSFRGGPWGDNYLFRSDQIPNLRRSMGNSGSVNGNFSNDVQGYGRTDVEASPKIIDRVNGEYLPVSGTITPQQVFGDERHWTKMSFFVRMNTDPNVADGAFMQWIDDQLIFRHEEVQWVRPSEQLGNPIVMPKWNHIKIGGNDYFKTYPDEERRQEWYAIDDIIIATQRPNAPRPPLNPTISSAQQ